MRKDARLILSVCLLFVSTFVVSVQPVFAQVEGNKAEGNKIVKKENSYFHSSLFFSPAEVSLISRAMKGTVTGTKALGSTAAQIIPERRVISISGVIFRDPKDWVVWLNGRKLTPKNLLPEIVDIQVKNQLVHLKWFDIGINDIISITLRPHQTYDIVTGVLLPGSQ